MCQCWGAAEVLQDLKLRQFRASERTTGYDQELLCQYQSQFFADDEDDDKPAELDPKGKGKDRTRKVEKCPWGVTAQRESGHMHIQALDKQLELATGKGLIQFRETDRDAKQVAKDFLERDVIPPVLNLHLDQGSPAYCMTWFLLGWVGLRMNAIPDPFHRSWNDVKMGVGKRLRFVVLLMVVVFNLPFGPWQGGAWYEKLLTMSEEMAQSMNAANPLFIALYELLCADHGLEPVGDATHRKMVFDLTFSSDAFRTRGEKVSLRRWFGWLSAAHKFLPHWHSKLMGIVGLGQVQGVYKSYLDVPLWVPAVKPPQEVLDADPPQEIVEVQEAADTEARERAEKRAKGNAGRGGGEGDAGAAGSADKTTQAEASRQAQESSEDRRAASAAAAAVRDSAPEPKDDKGPVNEQPSGTEQLKDLWKQHKRHLYVACCALSQDGMKENVAMILEVCRAVWTQHSSDAHTVRSPEDTFKYYLSAAKQEFVKTLEESASVMLNLQKLKTMGFLTDFGSGIPAGTTVTSDIVQSQSAQAYTLVDLFTGTTFHRLTSMMWHSHSWFGLPALLGSDDEDDYKKGKELLIEASRAYQAGLDMQRGSTFIRKITKTSAFKYTFMKELAEIIMMETDLPQEEVRRKVRKYILLSFCGWGQTKICEDTFKEMRYREKTDTLNMRRSPSAVDAAMHEMGTIGLRKRTNVEVPDTQLQAPGSSKGTFYCDSHIPSIANHRDITQTCRWNTYTPQSSKQIFAHMVLLNF